MDEIGFNRQHEVKEEVPDDGVWLLLQLLHQPLQEHLLPARYILKGGHQGVQQRVGTKNRFAPVFGNCFSQLPLLIRERLPQW